MGLAALHQDQERPEFWDAKRIKLPIFGPIAHKICLARFTRTLASLVRSGVPILEVLQIVSQTVGNTFWKRPSRPPPPTSSAAKAFPRRWPNTRFPQHDHPHDDRRRTDRQH
jgi:hypothetical protein